MKLINILLISLFIVFALAETTAKTLPTKSSKTVPKITSTKTVPTTSSKTVPKTTKTVPKTSTKTVPTTSSKTVPKTTKTVPKTSTKTFQIPHQRLFQRLPLKQFQILHQRLFQRLPLRQFQIPHLRLFQRLIPRLFQQLHLRLYQKLLLLKQFQKQQLRQFQKLLKHFQLLLRQFQRLPQKQLLELPLLELLLPLKTVVQLIMLITITVVVPKIGIVKLKSPMNVMENLENVGLNHGILPLMISVELLTECVQKFGIRYKY
ncbi:hypothetical protein BCR32DRAFT_125125 [Anaeromyces robustus]|uniref:Uncharacterized protein n=1 Tax=Anaeromyces robustus TaxID=1754192 RepID=A0A1Y1XFJ3_9FUNG|nr:hypothetical protein BCR32DRAFT_125125 [Anaeromyces robustus]|eukprot:ORX84525.1 hypothetical protein BCR32DRAFT_125125 [Anaeromyces robustus]